MNPVDHYISQAPKQSQKHLRALRALIKKAAPKAEECISYGMPAYRMKRVLVYFAGYAKHVGFYPSGSGIAAFAHELDAFKWSKGAIQFPLDAKLPSTLITRIVKHRVKEEAARS